MKNSLFRGLIVFVTFSVFGLNELIASDSAGLAPCDGPTESVKVIAQRISASPSIYSYTVSNYYQSPIVRIIFGDSDHREMLIEPSQIPKVVDSPEGWEGRVVFGHESEYMSILWLVKNKAFQISQGDSLGGYKLTMPELTKSTEKLYRPDGTPVTLVNMEQVPFRVHFEGFKCVWGRAVEGISKE